MPWFSVLLILLPQWSLAAEDGVTRPVVGGGELVTASPWVVVFGLLVVVALIFASGWLLRRMGGAGLTGNAHMKVIASLALGTRERLVLVEVGGKQILLGVAPGSVREVHYFDETVVDAGADRSSEFANKMKQFMQASKS
jgi:flagellar protein FliO/FliZ